MYIPIWLLVVIVILFSEKIGHLIGSIVARVWFSFRKPVPKPAAVVASAVLIALALVPLVFAVGAAVTFNR